MKKKIDIKTITVDIDPYLGVSPMISIFQKTLCPKGYIFVKLERKKDKVKIFYQRNLK